MGLPDQHPRERLGQLPTRRLEPAAASGDIYIIKINAGIGPGVADFITSSITTANEQDGAILIIELDTPGGLAESIRTIVKAILASKIPIAVYVSPSGARADPNRQRRDGLSLRRKVRPCG